jgi:hypothetical protein
MLLVGGGELARRLGEVLSLVEHGTPVAIVEQRTGGQPYRIRASIVPGLPRETEHVQFVDLDGEQVTKPVAVNGHSHQAAVA